MSYSAGPWGALNQGMMNMMIAQALSGNRASANNTTSSGQGVWDQISRFFAGQPNRAEKTYSPEKSGMRYTGAEPMPLPPPTMAPPGMAAPAPMPAATKLPPFMAPAPSMGDNAMRPPVMGPQASMGENARQPISDDMYQAYLQNQYGYYR